MNFAQAIDPERIAAMMKRVERKPARIAALEADGEQAERAAYGTVRPAILAALAGKSLTAAEIAQVIPGVNRSTLAFNLSTMKKAGELIVDGDPMQYRYRLPA